MKSITFALALMFPILSNAQVQVRNPASKAFTDCLLSEVLNGAYTSLDGGESALRLIGKCKSEWNAWEDACMAGGGTDSSCTVAAGVLDQSTLKLLNK